MSDTALYRFYDQEGDLLYVGISATPWERWRQHRGEKSWWHDIAEIRIEHHADRRTALDAERDAIVTERPIYNVIHNRKSTGRIGDLKIPWTCWSCGKSAKAGKHPTEPLTSHPPSLGILTVPPDGEGMKTIFDVGNSDVASAYLLELRPYCHRRSRCWPELAISHFEEVTLPLPRIINDIEAVRRLWPDHWSARFDFYSLLLDAIDAVDDGATE